jgi:tetratricopeptide (TPR) repeat protein
VGWVLSAQEVVGPARWLWSLYAPDGSLAEQFQVEVDSSRWEWEALEDLPGHIARQTDPDDWLASEARLVSQVGRWVSDNLLGPVASRLAKEAPVEVELRVPAGSEKLLALPLTIAEVEDRSLAERRIVFAGAVEAEYPHKKVPVGDQLRVLAVFSVPVGEALLDLRRERKALADLAKEITARGRAIELRVLQYGATKAALKGALADDEGWDIVHLSGHGAPGLIVLEDETGQPQVVPADELSEWLQDARPRLKLVTLSACSSAAFTVAETLRSIGVDAPQVASSASVDARHRALGQQVAQEDRCAVVAMRYPVVDDFAIEFSHSVFQCLWEKHMGLAEAVGWSVLHAAKVPPTAAAPALSAFTPAVFGAGAAELHLVPPTTEGHAQVDTKMAGLRAEPALFVGRVSVITRANAALAPKSGNSGVLFYGMAGAGKSACALELAYGQQANFDAFAWFECPLEGASSDERATALATFSARLESILGVAVADKVHDRARLTAVLPKIKEAVKKRPVLVVLDNAESLLDGQGHWLDPSWGELLGALSGQTGRGRLVLTCRRQPEPSLPGLLVEQVHVLGPDEAVLLARNLPNLGRLFDGQPISAEDRQLARRVLELTGGHPKLLELADAHTGRPQVLLAMLDGAGQRWGSAAVDTASFLSGGEISANPVAVYMGLLDDWTKLALAVLDGATLLMMQFICCLEEPERNSQVVKANWADTWHYLGRPGPVPDHEALLKVLANAALLEPEALDGGQRYNVHPLVAATVSSATAPELQEAVDRALAAYWLRCTNWALGEEQEGKPRSGLVAFGAGRTAVYLARLGDWVGVVSSLEHVVHRDLAPAAVSEAIAVLRRAVVELARTDDELFALGVLGWAYRYVDPAQAERLLRRVERTATAAGRHKEAGTAAGELANVLRSAGRFPRALAAIKRKTAHTKAADLGPWTQLADEVQALEIRQIMGDDRAVLTEIKRLYDDLATLPDPPDENEAVNPWNVREGLYNVGGAAALARKQWDDALVWLGRQEDNKVVRGATELELASTRFNRYGPLVEKSELGEARKLLDSCRDVFERHEDYRMLAKCFSATADVENRLGHTPQAVELEQMALRLQYRQPEPEAVAGSHNNLGIYLRRSVDKRAGLAHLLAAGVIRASTGGSHYDGSVGNVAIGLAAADPVPITFEDLCAVVQETEGVHFAELVTALGARGEELMVTVLDVARDRATRTARP